MVDLIALAREKQAEAERKLQELEAQTSKLKTEIFEWQGFIDRAHLLTHDAANEEESDELEQSSLPLPVGPVKVRRDSLAGVTATILLEKGPMRLRDIAHELEAMGKGAEGKDFSAFTTIINTALWRRKGDLFRKLDGFYNLKTRDIEFVDQPSDSQEE